MFKKIAALCLLISVPALTRAATLEQSLAKLDPEERSRQACAAKGLDIMRKDPRLRKADRINASVTKPAVLKGTALTAPDGAVRVANKWYAVSYACQLSPDLMKATTFTFTLGQEIPKTDWEKNGLWG
jgi:hypothetical protein